MRNMSAPLDPSSSENCCSRLAWRERTPMTKKLPMPTASRMTRVWLPGRPRLRTAWRSGNHGARAIGWTARTTPLPTRFSTSATPAKPAQTIAPIRSDAACHPATAISAAPTAIAAATCSRSSAASRARIPAGVHQAGKTLRPGRPPRGAAAEQQQRLHPPDFQQRHQREQQRDQHPDRHPLPDRRQRQRIGGRAERRAEVFGDRAQRQPRQSRRPARCRRGRGRPPAGRRRRAPGQWSPRRTSESRRCGSSGGRTPA